MKGQVNPTRQRHYGADGEIKYVPHRNLFVGFWGGRVVVTKRRREACEFVLQRDYGAQAVAKPAEVKSVGTELKQFVDRQNAMNTVLKQPLLSLDSPADRQRIADSIDGALSPENLTCDGELSGGMVQAKYRSLTRAAQQLLALDPTVKFYEFSE